MEHSSIVDKMASCFLQTTSVGVMHKKRDGENTTVVGVLPMVGLTLMSVAAALVLLNAVMSL